MSTTVVPDCRRSRATSMPSPSADGGVPPPPHLTAAQQQELGSELRRELVILERRLDSERQAASAETRVVATHYDSVAVHGTNDTVVRRDVVANAIARLTAGAYGACSHCGVPIPYGRLLVMPEATHCLRCSGRS